MATRRDVLKSSTAAIGSAALSSCGWGSKKTELRWLGWEHYDVRELREEFEDLHDCVVRAQYFDGNSEARNKLRNGGADDFHLVMADGFWPRLYARDEYTVEIDTTRIKNYVNIFDDFKPTRYSLLQTKGDETSTIAIPNCWGGYGMTVNINCLKQVGIEEKDSESLALLFDERLKDRIATSARFEENIALAGILACHEMGTITAERPDGSHNFNPYDLTADELERCKSLLKKQQELLLTRWNDEDTLERLLRSQDVCVSPEWSGIYRRLRFEELDGVSNLNMKHILKPREGGLGWVDTWCLTRGAVEDIAVEELAYKWIDFRLRKESMSVIATDVGWAPCVDIRNELAAGPYGDRYIETLFLNGTSAIHGLYQFDEPSNPEKWESIWSEVLAT